MATDVRIEGHETSLNKGLLSLLDKCFREVNPFVQWLWTVKQVYERQIIEHPDESPTVTHVNEMTRDGTIYRYTT